MPDRERPLAGERPPKPLTRCYDRRRQALRRPLEPGQCACPSRRRSAGHASRRSSWPRGDTRRSTRWGRTAGASAGWLRRPRTPARCKAALGPRTSDARSRRPGPARPGNPGGAAVDGCGAGAFAWHPQTCRRHPAPDGLAPEPQLVELGQLLGRQRRPEVGVTFADPGQRRLADLIPIAAVARPATPPRDQALSTPHPVGLQEPEHLPLANADQPCRLRSRNPALVQIDERLQTPEFLLTHRDQRHRRPASLALGRARRLTSLSSQRLTFTSSGYTLLLGKVNYDKHAT